jgi:hypothetical protein
LIFKILLEKLKSNPGLSSATPSPFYIKTELLGDFYQVHVGDNIQHNAICRRPFWAYVRTIPGVYNSIPISLIKGHGFRIDSLIYRRGRFYI